MTARSVHTRFRAYQLGKPGDSFSFYANSEFTLIEARLTDVSRPRLIEELRILGKDNIDVLHITSWDQDHCALADLKEILWNFSPGIVEYPGYDPHCDSADSCLTEIIKYRQTRTNSQRTVKLRKIGPDYISNLSDASRLAYNDIFYHPKRLIEGATNDNSSIKVFRKGSFNLASLGDVETITFLKNQKIFVKEVDVLLIAHHGADCETNSKSFLESVRPRLAICGSNFDNQFEHPKPEVRKRLRDLGIPLFTTKTGDVIVESIHPHVGFFRALNLVSNSTELKSVQNFEAKKAKLLSYNDDTIRNIYK